MKNLSKIFSAYILFIGAISCTNESISNPETIQELSFSLIAPNGEYIASDMNELHGKLSGLKSSEIKILDIQYFNVKEKTKLAASLYYEIDGVTKSTILIRNIENLKFNKGTVINFSNQGIKSNESRFFGGDIYISCSGSSCCFPSGTYDPSTGTITTACKCEGGNNSVCVMKISETPPPKQ